MNLDEALSRAYAKGTYHRIGRCPTRCGLKDSMGYGSKKRPRQDHLCLLPRHHLGGHEFMGTCGRNLLDERPKPSLSATGHLW
jgi:hypothetical protein